MGYEKKIIREGSGPTPVRGQTVTVHCTGYGKNRDLNVPFWSTKDPGQKPFSFQLGLGKVIKAWDEGVATMKLGEVARITATPDYAYGAGGFPAWGFVSHHKCRAAPIFSLFLLFRHGVVLYVFVPAESCPTPRSSLRSRCSASSKVPPHHQPPAGRAFLPSPFHFLSLFTTLRTEQAILAVFAQRLFLPASD